MDQKKKTRAKSDEKYFSKETVCEMFEEQFANELANNRDPDARLQMWSGFLEDLKNKGLISHRSWNWLPPRHVAEVPARKRGGGKLLGKAAATELFATEYADALAGTRELETDLRIEARLKMWNEFCQGLIAKGMVSHWHEHWTPPTFVTALADLPDEKDRFILKPQAEELFKGEYGEDLLNTVDDEERLKLWHDFVGKLIEDKKASARASYNWAVPAFVAKTEKREWGRGRPRENPSNERKSRYQSDAAAIKRYQMEKIKQLPILLPKTLIQEFSAACKAMNVTQVDDIKPRMVEVIEAAEKVKAATGEDAENLRNSYRTKFLDEYNEAIEQALMKQTVPKRKRGRPKKNDNPTVAAEG